MHVVRYLEFFLDAILEFLNTASLFICLGESLDVPLVEGGHKASYDAPKHISGKSIELVCTGLCGSGREGDGRHFSHNGFELLYRNREGRRVNAGGALLG